jgi:effector-binding domain-containing protein
VKTALCTALALAIAPVTQDPELPDAEELLQAMRVKIGADQLAGHHNVTLHGKVSWEGTGEDGGLITEVYGGLRKARITTEFGAFGSFEMGANDDLVWEKNPLETLIRDGWAGSQYLRQYGLAQHTDWREMYTKAWCTGVEEIDGRRCWELQLAPRALVAAPPQSKEVPPPDQWYMDVETGLPRRYVSKSLGVWDEPVIKYIDVDDWRAIDGILYAHRAEMQISGFTMVIEYDAYQHDVELPADFFAPDEAVLTALENHRSGATKRRDEAIVVETLVERPLASIRVKVPHAAMQKTLSVLLPEVMQYVLAEGAAMEGPPLVRYHDFGDPMDMEAGMALAHAIAPKGRIKATTLPAGDTIVAWHLGPYEKLFDTHTRVQAYMDENGLEQRDACWEEYWTDPGMEPDPSKWRTKVLYPVKKKADAQ